MNKKNTSYPRPLRIGAAILGALLILLVPGRARADVTLSLREKVIQNLSSSGLTLAFRLSAINNGSTERRLTRYSYRVTVNKREFLNMNVELDEPLSVPAGGEVLIALPVKVTYSLLFDAVGPIEEKALCDAVGTMFFQNPRGREEKVAFAFSGEFPIFKDPRLEFLPLKVNTQTLGGADVAFRPKFLNSVSYDLLIEKIGFRLFLEDREVLSGAIPGDKSIPPLGERSFSLPFIVDFFDVGQEIRAMFDQGRVPFRFEGEIEIDSVWGPLLIKFDKTESVPVDRNP
jgi:hypothetical protein